MNNSHYAVLTTAYLPPVDYFRVIAQSSSVKIEQHENYQKQSYRNRCYILSANGPLSLNIPVDRTFGCSLPIRDVRIDYSREWQKLHWRAIVSAYRSSPYFEHYCCLLEPFYTKKELFLFDYNCELLETICGVIDSRIKTGLTECFQRHYNLNDYRYSIHPKRESPLNFNNEKGRYFQVFAHKFGFIQNLSIIDLLFNEGPLTAGYIQSNRIRT